jgi:hypothetical protein
MVPTVYLETTIPSYLAGRPSRDLVVAAHQQITHEWWLAAKTNFDLVISEAVLEEIRVGDPEMATRRLKIVEDLPVLSLNDGVEASSVSILQSWGYLLRLGPTWCISPSRSPTSSTIW